MNTAWKALEHRTHSSFCKAASKAPQTAFRSKPNHTTHTNFTH